MRMMKTIFKNIWLSQSIIDFKVSVYQLFQYSMYVLVRKHGICLGSITFTTSFFNSLLSHFKHHISLNIWDSMKWGNVFWFMDAPCITMQFQRFHKRLYGLYKNNVPKSTIFSNLNGVTKSGFGITFQNMTCSQKHCLLTKSSI